MILHSDYPTEISIFEMRFFFLPEYEEQDQQNNVYNLILNLQGESNGPTASYFFHRQDNSFNITRAPHTANARLFTKCHFLHDDNNHSAKAIQ